MTITKAVRDLLTGAAITGLLSLSPAAADTPRSHLYLVIENGGVVGDREQTMTTLKYVFGELTQLRRRRATRKTEIHIVLTANPTEVTWSGTPDDLYRNGQKIFDLIAFKDTCSDLGLAWEQVVTTVEITNPDETRLMVVGPGINAPFPCNDAETTITLPQKVPDEFVLGKLALKAVQLRLLLVHPDQDDVYLDYFRKTGVLTRARSGELDFDLMDPARTRAALGSILEDRR